MLNNQMIIPVAADTKTHYRAGMQERRIYSVAERLAQRVSHASGPFRNSQSRNALSNTAPPTIKTIHSSGVIGRFTHQQRTLGLATSRAINFYPRPAAAERVRVNERQSIATHPTASSASRPKP